MCKQTPVNMVEDQGSIRDFFKDIEFNEEQHEYKVGEQVLTSVSNTIKQYCKPFDAEKAAEFMARREGCSPQHILDKWEQKKIKACDKGHAVHAFGENYVFNKDYPRSTIPEYYLYEQAIVNFWDDIPEHIKLVVVEYQMYSTKYGLAGTSDIILYDTIKKGYIIADYKTNENLFKDPKGRKLLAPFDSLPDTPYSKYTLQLSYYQILFEQMGLNIVGKKIVWLLPDGQYQMYDTPDYTDILKQELNEKQRVNTKSTI